MNDRVPLTRTDLLKFNPRWDRLDRAVIDEDVDIQGGVIFERETTGYATIHVADKNGAWVLSVTAISTSIFAGRLRRCTSTR